MIKKILVWSLCLFFITACSQEESGAESKVSSNPSSRTEFLMGTVVTVKIYDEGKEDVLDSVFERIESLADKISTSDEEKEVYSEVDKINDEAGISPVKVSSDVFELISAGKSYSERANGSFDISIGPITELWHIGFPDARKPSQPEIDQALQLIGYSNIELNNEDESVFLSNPGMKLDLGAIAKGYITDEVLKVLQKNNVSSAIIDLGGNIYVLGKNSKSNDWMVGIQDPFSARGETIGKIPLSNKSVVTSGIYERYLEVGDTKYHHLLNPKDGYPFTNDIAGVTIISDHSIDGDALSTTIFSKGIEEGLTFIEEIENVEAIFVTHQKEVYLTEGLKKNFELTNEDFNLVE